MMPGAVLRLDAAPTNALGEGGARLSVGSNLVVRSNAWLVVQGHTNNGALVDIRVSGDAAIDAFGGIDADARAMFRF